MTHEQFIAQLTSRHDQQVAAAKEWFSLAPTEQVQKLVSHCVGGSSQFRSQACTLPDHVLDVLLGMAMIGLAETCLRTYADLKGREECR